MTAEKLSVFTRKLFPAIVISMAMALWHPGDAAAGIGVTPQITEMTVAKGAVVKGIYTVINDSAETVRVRVEPEDWMKLKTGKSIIPLDQWLAIAPSEFDVAPKGVTEVGYTITAPQDERGELAAMVFFSTAPQATGNFDIATRFGVSVYAAIEGTIEIAAEVKDVRIEKGPVDPAHNEAGLTFFITVANKGNVHLRPTGVITIRRKDDRIYTVPVERSFPVYPGTELVYPVAWKTAGVAPGSYEGVVTLDCGNIYKVDKKIEKRFTVTVS